MATLPTPTYLRNFESVLARYGYWPSFHDSPLRLFEHNPVASTLELWVAVFDATRHTDARGHFGTTNHSLIHCQFGDVADVTLQHFDVPNTLIEMVFSPVSVFEATGRFNVELTSVLGGDCAVKFSAASGEVVSVTGSSGS